MNDFHRKALWHIIKAVLDKNSIKSLFNAADEGWRLLNKDGWFGSFYQRMYPSTWGNQYLHANLNLAWYKNVQDSITKLEPVVLSKAQK